MKSVTPNRKLELARRGRLAAVLAPAVAAGLGAAGHARAANTVYIYTGGSSYTTNAPVSGNFSTGFVGGPPVSASTAELDFGGASSSYTATDDIGTGTFTLTEMQLNNTSTSVTDYIAPLAAGNTFTFTNNGTGAATILQNGVGAFTISNGIVASKVLTIGGTGTGALALTGSFSGPLTDNYTGSTVTISNLASPVILTPTNVIKIGGGAVVQTASTLVLTGTSSANEVSGAGTLRFASTTSSTTNPDLQTFPGNSLSYYNETITSTVDLGSTTRYFELHTGRNDEVRYGGDTIISGTITGTGGLNLFTNGPTGYITGGTLSLKGANTFTGTVTLGDDVSLYLNNNNALNSGDNVNIAPTVAPVSPEVLGLFLYGRSVTIGNLSGTATALVQNGSFTNESTTYAANSSSVLTVTETGNTTYAGSIIDGHTDDTSGAGTNTYYSLGLVKNGTGTLTLSGNSTYSGPTTVGGGLLSLAGSLGTTTVNVASGAAFAARPGVGTATLAGTLLLNPGSKFDMLDGSAGTFNVTGAGTAFNISGNTLGFDLTGSGADTIAVTSNAAVAGTNTINLVTGTSALQNGTFNLITAGGGLTGTFLFPNGSTTETVTVAGIPSPYTLSLINTPTAEEVSVSGAQYAFWKGGLSNNWSTGAGTSNTNFTTDATGATGAPIPGSSTNVVFTVTGGGANLNTVLGQDFTIASLTFTADASQSVTIGGNNNLTINGGGITINSNSGAHTISTLTLGLGASQTWTNNAGNPFTVTAPITGSASNLTFAGTGPFVLAGTNTYAATTIGAGAAVQVGNGGTTGSLGTGAVVDNGTLSFNRSDAGTSPSVAGAISGTGSLVQNGVGTTVVNGAVTVTGTTTVNSGVLQVGSLAVPAYTGAVTVQSGANLSVTGAMNVPGNSSAVSISNGAGLSVGGTLTVNPNTAADVTPITGSGTLYLNSSSTSAANPDIYANVSSSAYFATAIGVNIYVGAGTHYIGGHSGNNSFGEYADGDLGLLGSLSGPGSLYVSGAPQSSQFEVALYNDNTQWTGGLIINRGDVALVPGNPNGLTANNTVTFNPAAGNIAALYLFGNNTTIGTLSGTGAGSMYIRNGSLTTSTSYPASDAVLTINQSANATFAGIISDGPDDYYSGHTGTYNHLGITVNGLAAGGNGPATLGLSGANTYTGQTIVNSGGLALLAGGSLGNTAVTVNSGATFGAAPGTFAGSTIVSGAGATLTINGGTFDMTATGTATTVGTFNLHQSTTFGGQALVLNSATLTFGVSSNGASSIVSDSPASVSGTNVINVVPVAGATFGPATYALISAPSGLTGTFDFSNNQTTETVGGVSFSLINTDGAEELAVAGGSVAPLNAYYTGSINNNLSSGGNGSPTNFSTDATGSTNTNFLPGAITNVFFTANNAQNPNVVLGGNLGINSLTFTGNSSSATVIGGSNTLTIGAGGITLTSGAPGATIATGGLVVGADQTWTNNSGNAFLVTAPVSGGNLTFSGPGLTVLAGVNSYGNTIITAGANVQVGNGVPGGTLGTGSVTDNGSLTFNRSDSFTVASAISGTGTITQSGTGTTTLGGAVTVTGAVVVNSGGLVANTLTTAGSVTLNGGTFLTNSLVSGGTVNINAGTMTVNSTFNTSANSVVSIAAGATLQTGGTLNLLVATTANDNLDSNNITGGGTLRLISTTDSVGNPDIFFGPDHSGTTYYGAKITAATLDLGSAQRFITSNSGHNSAAKYLVTSSGNIDVDAYISSSIIGSGGITYTGNAEGTTSFYAPLVLAGANTFTGTLDVEQGSVYLDNASALNLPAGNPLVLNNNGVGYSHLFLLGNNATVSNLTSGGSTPAATAIANGNPTMNFAVASAALTVVENVPTTFAGTLANTITDGYDYGTNVAGAVSLIKTGPATLTLTGTSNYNGSTTVAAGNLTYAAAGTGITSQSIGALNVASGASLTAAIAANHANRQLLVTTGLTNAGTIDLGNNDLDITNGNLQAVTQQIAAGYNLTGGGKWNGTPGSAYITSTAAANDTTHLTALGVIDNTENGATVFPTTFDGHTVGASDVLVKYTYFGDANLDGKVDGSDYSLIDAGYASHGALSGWYNGDFNYDGVIDGSDYALIDNAFNNQGVNLSTSAVVATATAQVAGPTAVPEPASVALLAVAGAGLLGRRRRN